MTVPLYSPAQFTGNGVTTLFPYTFRIPSGAARVSTYNPASFVETVLIEGVDYSVSAYDADIGGMVTYPLVGSPLAGPLQLIINRNVPLTQELDLNPQSNYDPTQLEEELDEIVMMLQYMYVNGGVSAAALLAATNSAQSSATSASVSAAAALAAAATNVKLWGAKGDGTTGTTGTATSGSVLFTDPASAWTSADVGKYIEVTGAGVAGAVKQTTIAHVNSATSINLASVASTTVTGTAAYTYGTDDAPAIQAALDYMLSSKQRASIYLPPGTYLTGSVITISSIESGIIGSGMGLPCTIKAFHSLGPVLRVQSDRQKGRDVTISATPARTNGSAGAGAATNGGILQMAAVSLVTSIQYDHVMIRNQPAYGALLVGTVNHTSFFQCVIQNNLTHAIQWDNGTLTGTTLSGSGLMDIELCSIVDNGGHGLMVGHETQTANRGVRIVITNSEFDRNAQAAGSRRSADQVWIFGSQVTIQNSGFSGYDQSNTVETTGGIRVAGQDIKLLSNRFLNVTDHAIYIDNFAELPTQGVIVDGVLVSILGAALDPAVKIATGCTNIDVHTGATAGINSLTDVTQVMPLVAHVTRIVKGVDETLVSSTVLQNDDGLTFNMPFNRQVVTFRAVLVFSGPAAGDIKFTFMVPAGASLRFGTPTNIVVDASDTVSIQNTVVAAGTTITAGTAASRRTLELVGEVITTGTSGDVTLQWAQATSDPGTTTVYGTSYIEVNK